MTMPTESFTALGNVLFHSFFSEREFKLRLGEAQVWRFVHYLLDYLHCVTEGRGVVVLYTREEVRSILHDMAPKLPQISLMFLWNFGKLIDEEF